MSRRYTSTATSPPPPALLTNAEGCLSTQVGDGTVIVFSDAHYSDLPPTTAHRALVRHAKISAAEGHLRAVVNGGDALDLASISRHPRSAGGPRLPSLGNWRWGRNGSGRLRKRLDQRSIGSGPKEIMTKKVGSTPSPSGARVRRRPRHVPRRPVPELATLHTP
jgi:hypothetical protein